MATGGNYCLAGFEPLNNWCNLVQLPPRWFWAAQQLVQSFWCIIPPPTPPILGGELIHLFSDRGSDPLLPVLAQEGQTPCPTVHLNEHRGGEI